MLKIRNKETFV